MKYFNIAWYSCKDGPGTRAVLFLQGCNLHCKWCHSPHSQGKMAPVLYYEEYCKHCGKCVVSCQNGCHALRNGKHEFNRSACKECLKCVEACSNGALGYQFTEETVSEIYRKLETELRMLKGNGGLTVSGGEPMLWSNEVRLLLKQCKENGIHTAIETSAAVSTEKFEELVDVVDCWLFGLKQTVPELSKEMTGIDIKLVEKNLRYLSSHGENHRIIIRFPLIGGYTNNQENIVRIAEIMQENSLSEIQILPYNLYTSHYYKASGLEFEESKFYRPKDEEIGNIQGYFMKQGIKCSIVK